MGGFGLRVLYLAFGRFRVYSRGLTENLKV